MKKVLITGITGKMGIESVKAILADNSFEISGGITKSRYVGEDIGKLISGKENGIKISDDFEKVFQETRPDILLDITNSETAMKYLPYALSNGCKCITGSTGFEDFDLIKLRSITEENKTSCFVMPNFSIGAVLMTMFSKMAGKYFKDVEIIEMHHEAKKDSPSGTAIKTAEMILSNNHEFNLIRPESFEKIPGSRGGTIGNINVHSIRIPGFVATQEVIFGGLGQTLTVKHSTINREAYMPGVIFCLNKIQEIEGYVYGMENIL